jgi:ArsR family transcriptional regulator
MSQNKMISVLFLCTDNATRSPMAEAILREKGAGFIEVDSAGINPEPIDSCTLQAIERFGLSHKQLRSKHVSEFADKHFDYVISLCGNTNHGCFDDVNATQQLAWDIADPKTRLIDNPFLTTLLELNRRIEMFLSVAAESQFRKTIEPMIDPITFYKCLTDDIRLKTLMLTHYHGELCVCELMHTLQEESQPKVSRNLAVLKKANILSTRKHGQWVFYRINMALPEWVKSVIAQTTEHNCDLIREPLQRLAEMQTRPNKVSICG